MRNIAFILPLCIVLATGCKCLPQKKGDKLNLAKNAQTDYVIVKPAEPTAIDEYAIRELTGFMKRKTEAEFPTVFPDKLPAGKKYIFVGLSKPALKILGNNPLKNFKDQEHTYKSIGHDIFLYGKGKHGNMYAVFDFMENILGWRRFRKNDQPTFSPTPYLLISPFKCSAIPDFSYRLIGHPSEVDYQNGINMGMTEWQTMMKNKYNKICFPPGVVSRKYIPAFAHTTFSYIPPEPTSIRYDFPWLKNKNYYKSNPDFFAMKKGKREKNHQLCFGNEALRAELTKNVLTHIKKLGKDELIIAVAPEDLAGRLCECPKCKALEEKYQCSGGPYFDYIFELCKIAKEKFPHVKILATAYHIGHTQKPPTMPSGKKLPDNLIIFFASAEDKIDVAWDNPVNSPNYKDILTWKKIAHDVWVWTYPNPYCVGNFMPLGNIYLMQKQMRMLKKAGIQGVFFEFAFPSSRTGDGFADLQRYIYWKLTKNVESNVPQLIKEFTDYEYGKAAPLVRTYLDELEEGLKKLPIHMERFHCDIDLKGQFAYLTNKNIRRWHGYFDKMEKTVDSNQRNLKNVQKLRRKLEYATLLKWNDLSKAYPDYFKDYLVHKKRLGDLSSQKSKWIGEDVFVADCEINISAAGRIKPLPEEFRGIDSSQVCRFIPEKHTYTKEEKKKIDPDAAFGYAAIVHIPELPFHFGYYPWRGKEKGLRKKIEKNEIIPDVYKLYKLGTIEITPKGMIWFSSKSWQTHLEIGKRLFKPEVPEDNYWNAWVSLKFSGPSYGGKASKDLVLCDQIILVKKTSSNNSTETNSR